MTAPPARKRTRTLQRLLEDGGVAAWLIDAAGVIVYLSPAMADQLGHPADDILGRSTLAIAGQGDAPTGEVAGVATIIPPSDPLDRLASLLGLSVAAAERGYETRELPLPAGSGPPMPVAAHWVRLQADPPLVLGMLGDFLLDTELDASDFQSPAGIGGRAAIARAVDHWHQKHAELSAALLLGQSPAAAILIRRSELAAAARCSMTIVGGPGCGWRSLAIRIHAASAPGEPVASVDGSLMDAELMSVYAGPIANQIESDPAGRGTLLIDRIEDLPADAAGVVMAWSERFGDRLRLIGRRRCDSATELPPGLAGPLATLQLIIPPLADRIADLPHMVQKLTRGAATGTAPPPWSAASLHRLSVYPWPHQFDELVDVVAHAVDRHAADRSSPAAIQPEHLPLLVRSYRAGVASGDTASAKLAGNRPPATLDEQLAALELKLIDEAVHAAGGNKAEAARQLGISRARLLRRLDS